MIVASGNLNDFILLDMEVQRLLLVGKARQFLLCIDSLNIGDFAGLHLLDLVIDGHVTNRVH